MRDTGGMSDTGLPVVYADETHNTGENLVDDDQPVFAVGGAYLPDDLARDLVEQVKSSRPPGAGEPKYQALSRRPAGKATLLSALSQLPDGAAKVVIANKRYMTVSKIVDLMAEPMMYENGYNMLADGSAKSLAHIVFFFGSREHNEHAFDAVLRSFIDVMRTGLAGVEKYATVVEDYLATLPLGQRDTFQFALLPSKSMLVRLIAERENGSHLDTLDPAVPAVAMLCDAFHTQLGPFNLVHDESKVIERSTPLLLNMDKLPDPRDPANKNLALPARTIQLAASKDIPQLQIVDWIAGAARDLGMSYLNPPRKIVIGEWETMVKSWVVGDIWPSFDWLRETLNL
jgi:hypothetical protein